MRRMFLLWAYLFLIFGIARAAVINWTGVLGGNWNVAGNWSPAQVPGPGDDVVFSSSVNVELDIIPANSPFTYVINSLRISGGAYVVLSRTQAGGGSRILQVKSNSLVNPGLLIDAGSTLVMNAANSSGSLSLVLDLCGSAGVTGEISGSLYFTGTGAGGGDAHLNLYGGVANYAGLVVRDQGLIRYFTNSGNTSSASGSYLRMEAGSVYEINKNGGSIPYGSWDDRSTILISGATANGGIIFSQSSYGSMEWNCPGMSAVTQMIGALSPVNAISLHDLTITNTNGRELRLKTGAASMVPPYSCAVRGKLVVSPAGIFVITGINVVNSGAGARLTVAGDMDIGGVLRSDGIAGTVNDLEFNGSTIQGISINGVFAGGQIHVIVNNPSGIRLLTALTIPGLNSNSLQLTNGKIRSSSANMLTMQDNAGYTGGSATSFVEGPMRKLGRGSFNFPIGKGAVYAPLDLAPTAAMAIQDSYQAEYFRINPQSLYGANVETPLLHHVSYVEYWELNRGAGSTVVPANITLTVNPYSFAKDLNSVYPARYNVSDLQWKSDLVQSRNAGPSSPPYITGTVSTMPVTEMGVFTLATSEVWAINPLPVRIRSFEARRVGEGIAMIRCETEGMESGSKVELERSVGAREFASLQVIEAPVGGGAIMLYDKEMPDSGAAYRIRIRGVSASDIYSEVAVVKYSRQEKIAVRIIGNPVRKELIIQVDPTNGRAIHFAFIDAGGRVLKKWSASTGDYRKFSIPVEKLLPGAYWLMIDDGFGRKALPFVKIE